MPCECLASKLLRQDGEILGRGWAMAESEELACMVFGKADIGQYEAEDRTKSYET